MNDWQIVQQVQFRLRKATWPDSPSEVVFSPGAVLVSGGITEEAMAQITARPIVLIAPGAWQADPELAGLGTTTITIRLLDFKEDRAGESVLVGGNRKASGGIGSSEGRGLLEVEEEVLRALERMNDVVGIRIAGNFKGATEAVYVQDMGYVASRVLTFEVDATRARYYHAPQRLVLTPQGGGSGVIAGAWALPPDRFDFHAAASPMAARGRIIVRRSSGLTAPQSITDGTGVTLSGDFATSFTDTPGVGATYWSYTVFAAYDETPVYDATGAGVSRYSTVELGTYRTAQAS